MWLCEAGEERLLFDPLLEDTHHCGVYQTVPLRTLHLDRLRPTAILVSHRHPDHFDVGSLHKLAQQYPNVPLYSPDALVRSTAERLGFTDTRSLVAGDTVELRGVRMTATVSLAKDEWGLIVATEDGAVWNQVDTVLRNAAHVRDVAAQGCARVRRPKLDLALVRWQPMHEVAAQLGQHIGFPYNTYADLLAQVVATGAAAVVPSACGASHVHAFGWMDHIVYPVTPQRFLADMTNFEADVDAFPALLGAQYILEDGEVDFLPDGGATLIESRDDAPDPRQYRPLSVPALSDVNPNGHPESTTRPEVAAWIEQALAPALAGQYPKLGVEDPLNFVVEVQYADALDAFTLAVGQEGVAIERASNPDWDAIVAIAGSLFWEVIAGQRGWGDVLLAGALRSQVRAYAPFNGKVRKIPLAPIFLYYALPYERSFERAVAWEVEQVLGTP